MERSIWTFHVKLVFTNIGHQHPKVVKAIQEQAAILATIAPQHANAARNEAARRIVDLAGPKFQKVFFTNAGARSRKWNTYGATSHWQR